jgi:hypothetical protein
MNITNERLDALLELVHKHFPDWNLFADERFLKEEITYKRDAASKAK